MDRDALLERVLTLGEEEDWGGAAELLRDHLDEFDEDPAVQFAAIAALGRLEGKPALPALLAAIEAASGDRRAALLRIAFSEDRAGN